ncbi:MAG: YciI family protein [Hyphomicrobiales bacterium]
MLYTLICTDKPDMLAVRQDTRAAHLEFLKGLGDRLKAGGPFIAGDGETPIGSLVIIEASSLEDAKKIASQDPYARAGLFQSVDIRPWKWVLNNPEGG